MEDPGISAWLNGNARERKRPKIRRISVGSRITTDSTACRLPFSQAIHSTLSPSLSFFSSVFYASRLNKRAMTIRGLPLLNFGFDTQSRTPLDSGISDSGSPSYDDETTVKRWYHYIPVCGAPLYHKKPPVVVAHSCSIRFSGGFVDSSTSPLFALHACWLPFINHGSIPRLWNTPLCDLRPYLSRLFVSHRLYCSWSRSNHNPSTGRQHRCRW